ncbi:unnamed protein product, partial [Didymodactylos carnosus]
MIKNIFQSIGLVSLLLCVGEHVIYAQAQSGKAKIWGKVVDENHKPVSYKAITLVNAKDTVTVIRGTLTSEDGDYVFDHIVKGNYFVMLSPAGQKRILKGPIEVNDTTTSVKMNDIDIVTVQVLNQVNIVSRKPLIEQQTDKTVLNIENSSLAAGNSVMDVLQRSPGVTVSDQGNIVMKGKAGVTVMIDGRLTYLSGDQLASLLKSMQANSVQAIELITNPSSKYDAAGSAGIINIRLLKN